MESTAVEKKTEARKKRLTLHLRTPLSMVPTDHTLIGGLLLLKHKPKTYCEGPDDDVVTMTVASSSSIHAYSLTEERLTASLSLSRESLERE